jgi:hypothetical protein
MISRILIANAMIVATPASAVCEWGPCSPALKTTVLDVQQEAVPARDIQIARFGGYELADGQFQSFSRWYAGRLTFIRADLITQLTPGIGLLWGLSGGERGEKYTLQPSLRAGLVAVASLSSHSTLSLTARTTLGGRLLEKPCSANYGAIGGVQLVNCRLANSELSPESTLTQLWNFAPVDQTRLTLRLTTHF